ncbi:MAG: cytochrome b561 [Paraglaciecola sp.]|jgi:cytochrome b561
MNTEKIKEPGYGKSAKFLHWGMALMLIVLIAVGTYMTGLDKADPSKMQIVNYPPLKGLACKSLILTSLSI